MILVVCALRPELGAFAAPPGVEMLAAGVGPVESALATARRLAKAPYEAVINAGIGGAFRGAAVIGEAVLVEEESFAGLGLEGGGTLSLPGNYALVEHVRADPGLLERCARLGMQRLRGLTVTTITTTDGTARLLRERYDAGVESMEGFSVLRAAAVAGVPALEVRGISNYVGDRATSDWDFGAGARAAAAALGHVLDAVR